MLEERGKTTGGLPEGNAHVRENPAMSRHRLIYLRSGRRSRNAIPTTAAAVMLGPVTGELRALVVPFQKPGAICEECTHPLTLHDEDGFCTVSCCDCEGAGDEGCPEAPLIRNDYGPEWWEDASVPPSSRRYWPFRLAVFWPFAGRATRKRARRE